MVPATAASSIYQLQATGSTVVRHEFCDTTIGLLHLSFCVLFCSDFAHAVAVDVGGDQDRAWKPHPRWAILQFAFSLFPSLCCLVPEGAGQRALLQDPKP